MLARDGHRTSSRIASRTGVARMANSFTSVASTTRWPGGSSPRAMRSSSVSWMNSHKDLTGGRGGLEVLGIRELMVGATGSSDENQTAGESQTGTRDAPTDRVHGFSLAASMPWF
jgi:hypothetical protein